MEILDYVALLFWILSLVLTSIILKVLYDQVRSHRMKKKWLRKGQVFNKYTFTQSYYRIIKVIWIDEQVASVVAESLEDWDEMEGYRIERDEFKPIKCYYRNGERILC